VAVFLFSAQRLFIASEMRFLPAAVMPPRRFATIACVREGLVDFDMRAAQRAFIACDSRFLPAGVIPLPRFGEAALPFVRRAALAKPTPSRSALMALPIRSRSLFSSETILSRSNRNLLCSKYLPR
jgi:hypothetical protein